LIDAALVDARALACFLAEAVADGVLDLQRDEVEALQRRILRADFHRDGFVHIEPLRPRQVERGAVDVFFLVISGVADLAQDARGNPRRQVGAHLGGGVGHEQHAGRQLAHDLRPGSNEFRFEQRLQPARTGGKMAGRRQHLAFGADGMRGFATTGFGLQAGLSEKIKTASPLPAAPRPAARSPEFH
jgi:hypothetical protein